MVPHDARVVALAQTQELSTHVQRDTALAVLERQHLEGHGLTAGLWHGAVHLAVGAFADLVAELEIRRDRLGECRLVRCNGAQRLARLKL